MLPSRQTSEKQLVYPVESISQQTTQDIYNEIYSFKFHTLIHIGKFSFHNDAQKYVRTQLYHVLNCFIGLLLRKNRTMMLYSSS